MPDLIKRERKLKITLKDKTGKEIQLTAIQLAGGFTGIWSREYEEARADY